MSPMQQIPILINRKSSSSQEPVFRILPLENKVKICHKRQKTHDSIEKPLFEERQHYTLDPNKRNGEYRYRRISSSGNTHKFPKDFFNNNDLPRTPIKIRFSRSKKESLLESNTPTRLAFMNSEPVQMRHNQMKYTLQSPQKNCQPLNQVQTPKFNSKKVEEDEFCEFKSKTTNRKTKIEDYLSHKKENFPVFFKHTKDYYFQQDKSNDCEQKCTKTIIDKKNDDQVLIETLGKNPNLLKQVVNQAKNRKRNISQMQRQKQNRQDTAMSQKKNPKSIKAFLSTKGLNWKVLQKLNQMKPFGGESQCGVTFNLKKQNVEREKIMRENKDTMTRQKKALSDLFEQNEKNTFRIRRYH